jgi:hypothetical protein
LLCTRDSWPSRHTTNQRNELPSSHSTSQCAGWQELISDDFAQALLRCNGRKEPRPVQGQVRLPTAYSKTFPGASAVHQKAGHIRVFA